MRRAISFVLVGLLLVNALVACDAPDGEETATTDMTADVTSTKTTAESTSPETTPDDSGTSEGTTESNTEVESTAEVESTPSLQPGENEEPIPGIRKVIPPNNVVQYSIQSYETLQTVFDRDSKNIVQDEKDEYGDLHKSFVDHLTENGSYVVPMLHGEKMELESREGYSKITLFTRENYGWSWLLFRCTPDDTNIVIRVSCPSCGGVNGIENGMTHSEVIRTIKPTAPNVDNYMELYSDTFSDISEISLSLADCTVSALCYEMVDEDRIRVEFMYRGMFVRVDALPDILTPEFWSAFSLGSIR